MEPSPEKIAGSFNRARSIPGPRAYGFSPPKNWAAQVSVGRITHPEALEPGDQMRSTGSLSYRGPTEAGLPASSGAAITTPRRFATLNSYLLESVLPIGRKNFITGRIELVDKDELFDNQTYLPIYGSTFRIGAYTLGYTRDIELFSYVETGIGANFSFYSLPDAIKPYYGDHPVGGNIFVRLRLRKST